jgi:hypothetical protein
MTYLYKNYKGKYERWEERKEITRTFMFLFGLSLLGLLMGSAYLMFSYL